MTETEYLLICLAEECAEVQQRISKAIRFGLFEKQKDQELSNSQRIAYELNDISSVLHLLATRDIVYFHMTPSAEKIQKLEKYMKYSKELGILKTTEVAGE